MMLRRLRTALGHGLAALGQSLYAYEQVWSPGMRRPVDDGSPPAGHPERLCHRRPSAAERAIWRQLESRE